jgi:hypothetical protein
VERLHERQHILREKGIVGNARGITRAAIAACIGRDDAEVLGEEADAVAPTPLMVRPDGAVGDPTAVEQQERRALTGLDVPDVDPVGVNGVFRYGNTIRAEVQMQSSYRPMCIDLPLQADGRRCS